MADDPEIPPQPYGDTSDAATEARNSGWDDVLGMCTVCGEFKPGVGMVNPNSPPACLDCRKKYLPAQATQAVPGNPLNL